MPLTAAPCPKHPSHPESISPNPRRHTPSPPPAGLRHPRPPASPRGCPCRRGARDSAFAGVALPPPGRPEDCEEGLGDSLPPRCSGICSPAGDGDRTLCPSSGLPEPGVSSSSLPPPPLFLLFLHHISQAMQLRCVPRPQVPSAGTPVISRYHWTSPGTIRYHWVPPTITVPPPLLA